MASFGKTQIFFSERFILSLILVLFLCIGCSDRQAELDGQEEDLISEKHRFEIHFINVGQGDAILVLTPSKTMLIDAGPLDGNAAGYLRSLGVTEIDVVIATHPHADHIGGMPDIFESFPVREIVDPGVVHSTLTYRRYLELIDELDIPYTEGRKGMSIDLGIDAFAEILHPSDTDEELLNDASIVLRLALGNLRVLLAGDIEKLSEELLLDGHNSEAVSLRSHIFKVPHHGSSTSSHSAFIDAVNPDLSIIMCGIHNSYGNPHRRTLAVMEAAGSAILRTDMNGHIVIRSDGDDYVVDVERDAPLIPSVININTASKEELQYIVHIGYERAEQIIRLRPFASADDLIRVDGIGPTRLVDIKRQNIIVVE
ncbi:MAG: MBL fold metallo-hydrolase [Bacteroidales bacterium]